MPNIRKYPKEFVCLGCGVMIPNKHGQLRKWCTVQCFHSHNTPWNLGNGEYARKLGIGKWMIGRKASLETKLKHSLARKGKTYQEIFGDRAKEEYDKRLGKLFGVRGEKSHSWRGGISKRQYPSIFNRSLKLKVRTRDGFRCCLCGMTEEDSMAKYKRVLSVNHIDFNKENCDEKNLNTLCVACNTKINLQRDFWQTYFGWRNGEKPVFDGKNRIIYIQRSLINTQ